MKRIILWRVFLIILITFLAVFVVKPNNKNIKILNETKKIDLVKGLDIAGGSQLTYKLDLSKTEENQKQQATESVLSVIRKRVDSLGVSEPVIQAGTLNNQKIITLELPGIQDINQAIDLVGKTANLEFQEQSGGENGDGVTKEWKKTELTGKYLSNATITYQGGGGSGNSAGGIKSEPVVSISFNSDGAKLFEEITTRNVGKPVAIILDNEIVSAPNVNEAIVGGNAVISGNFDATSARSLSISLNSGALPVPLELISQRTVGAQLGNESISKSIFASFVAIILVTLFMIFQYKGSGVIASLALLIYIIIVLAVFKLIPVTITLAGIAGLILSIGAAVDANILIFERTKEESQMGKGKITAIQEGFRRAWSSIRDSNFSTIITSIILIWFGSGIVRGFAITLLIGILVSMFSAITISQTLLLLFSNFKLKLPKIKIIKIKKTI
ncbi:MAG: Preprotein translocase subunit SecD [Berkelbacteria bacterium GW2011_GWA2_35_9]|uniref:Protein translocase subunit SecD n=1 Tax=Berkelbacteria bacterium GW2011_GWA2_35_9 TaxID=1618333 RepID=A0A0G0FP42_9BACT|nr:MAG: Preprotein translocase subunit SecD [Berkelbacteria bacterium GW2011_GWA2_35_9]